MKPKGLSKHTTKTTLHERILLIIYLSKFPVAEFNILLYIQTFYFERRVTFFLADIKQKSLSFCCRTSMKPRALSKYTASKGNSPLQ